MRHNPALFLVIVAVALTSPVRGGEPGVSTPLIIGMPDTMLVDVADSERDILADRIAALMKEFTGLQGKLSIEKNIEDVASKLESRKIHLGVLQGVELAWLQKKHPHLRPLMIAASDAKEKRHLYTQLLVRGDSGVKDFSGLKDKSLAYPKKSKEHVRVFLDRNGGKGTAKSIISSPNVEKALDALLEGKVDAVLADKNGVDFYARIKRGAFSKLAVVKTSEAFPAGVLVYSEGGLDGKTLARVQKGMLKANTSERGQDLMADWNIASFEPVPENYQSDLDAILKAYPGRDGK